MFKINFEKLNLSYPLTTEETYVYLNGVFGEWIFTIIIFLVYLFSGGE